MGGKCASFGWNGRFFPGERIFLTCSTIEYELLLGVSHISELTKFQDFSRFYIAHFQVFLSIGFFTVSKPGKICQTNKLWKNKFTKKVSSTCCKLHSFEVWCLTNVAIKTCWMGDLSNESSLFVLNLILADLPIFFFFFFFFCWTKAQFVESLIAPVLDFVCPSSRVSNPEWISRLHSFLLACSDPEGHVWCDTCLFHQ